MLKNQWTFYFSLFALALLVVKFSWKFIFTVEATEICLGNPVDFFMSAHDWFGLYQFCWRFSCFASIKMSQAAVGEKRGKISVFPENLRKSITKWEVFFSLPDYLIMKQKKGFHFNCTRKNSRIARSWVLLPIIASWGSDSAQNCAHLRTNFHLIFSLRDEEIRKIRHFHRRRENYMKGNGDDRESRM